MPSSSFITTTTVGMKLNAESADILAAVEGFGVPKASMLCVAHDASVCEKTTRNGVRKWGGTGAPWRLTVKLRGRTTTSDERRGRILTSHARGAGPPTVHGPLQRLLEAG